MSRCAHCGEVTLLGELLCDHHGMEEGDDWATGNRLFCDLLHRGVVVPYRDKGSASGSPRGTVRG